MKTRSFGQYLVNAGHISKEDHETALHIQSKNRLLGEIAIEMNYLSREDIAVITDHMQKNREMMFGEAAISLGLLNSNQLRYLLDIRTRRKAPIGDILVKNGFIEEDVMLKALMSFNQETHTLESVLLVEQSKTILKMLEGMITKYGYTVFTTSSGKEAFKIAKEKKPDVMITGGILADINGYELCSKILNDSATATINMVLISSDDKSESVTKAFESGVNHFLAKPVREKELINVIYQIEREVSEKRKEKVLVVDDSRGARLIIYKELTHAGYQVFQAENGLEGVEEAAKVKPDIITMDIEMPKMDGFGACKKLKENPLTADIPVIIISSLSGSKVRNEGFDSGAVEFFQKPFKAGRLAAYVNMLLETKKIRKKEKVLVVEDTSTMRHILKYLFHKNGYNVYTAKDGAEALELLPQCNPDLIVTDCYMPGMDGIEFSQKVKGQEKFRHVPIIMLTGASGREDILKGLVAGASDYITKPFDEAELLARAGTHLLNKQLYDDLARERDELERVKNKLADFAKKMETLAKTDPLTNALNRRCFYEYGKVEFSRAARYKNPMSVLIIDIDHFKNINDEYGHPAGDQAIKDVVKSIGGTLRESDIFCRYGGEEFAAILVETSKEVAHIIADRLREKIAGTKVNYGGQSFNLSISVGISELSEGDGDIDTILNRSDKALYQAKEGGRNKVVSS